MGIVWDAFGMFKEVMLGCGMETEGGDKDRT